MYIKMLNPIQFFLHTPPSSSLHPTLHPAPLQHPVEGATAYHEVETDGATEDEHVTKPHRSVRVFAAASFLHLPRSLSLQQGGEE
jgi:hypothetical protein